MLDNNDIKKLTEAFVTVFTTKEELKALEQRLDLKFDKLYGAIDAYAKRSDAYFQEMVAMQAKLNRLEKWITQIAEKVDIKLSY